LAFVNVFVKSKLNNLDKIASEDLGLKRYVILTKSGALFRMLQTICRLIDEDDTGSAVMYRAGSGRPKSLLLKLVNTV